MPKGVTLISANRWSGFGYLPPCSGGAGSRYSVTVKVMKGHQAKLVIARLDRFSRNVSFISKIMDQGIELVIAEMPDATTFQLHIFAALAQEERRLISERTKAALAQAKKRGVELGRNPAWLYRLSSRTALKLGIATSINAP